MINFLVIQVPGKGHAYDDQTGFEEVGGGDGEEIWRGQRDKTHRSLSTHRKGTSWPPGALYRIFLSKETNDEMAVQMS